MHNPARSANFSALIARWAVLGLVLALAFGLAACDQDGGQEGAQDAALPAPAQEPEGPAPMATPASDEIAALAAAPTGIDFWAHPNVAFNSLMIVSSEAGLVAYNIENGDQVSAAPGIAFDGVAVSYFGFGSLAAGLVAAFDDTADVFRFYGVDNSSRLLTPLDGGPAVRQNVRGFCMGRAVGNSEPTLFVVLRERLRIMNLAPSLDVEGPGVIVSGETSVDIPGSVSSCAVDRDGVALLAGADGAVYRLDTVNAGAAPFVASGRAIDALSVIAAEGGDAEPESASLTGMIAALNAASATIALFDRGDGHALGAVTIAPTAQIDGVETATAMGFTGANMGGLYRNGMLALGYGGDAPGIRMAPANGVFNALSLSLAAPENPRGDAPLPQGDAGLIIDLQALEGE